MLEGQAKFSDKRKMPSDNYPTKGCFTLETPFKWYTCREEFGKVFTDSTKGFYFANLNSKPEDVANFIYKTEQILKITNPKIEDSVFSITDRPFALWVSPSAFWNSCFMKRSLFTILLRSGLSYVTSEDNYEIALYSDKYASPTSLSIRRFLFGFTEFSTSGNPVGSQGWYYHFNSAKLDTVRSKLTLPAEVENKKTLIGMGSIWN